MRRIVSENEAVADITKKTHGEIPRSGVFLPNYSGVNQFSGTPGGAGEISFMQSLSNMAGEYLNKQQRQYDAMEVSDEINRTNAAFTEADRNYLSENNSGKGYMEFATSTYKKLSDESLNRASNSEVRNALQMFFGKKQIDIANNAFSAEKSMYSAYILNTTEPKLNEVINTATTHPEQADSLATELQVHLEPLRGLLEPGKFEKIASQKNEQLIYAIGIGQIDKNPELGAQMLNGELFKRLSPSNYTRLQKYAESSIEQKLMERKREEYEIAHKSAIEQRKLYERYELAIARGENISSDLEKEQRLTDGQLAKLISKNKEKKEVENEQTTIRHKFDDALAYEKPMDLSAKEIEKCLNENVREINADREKDNLPRLSCTEKVNFIKSNSNLRSYPWSALKSEIVEKIKFASNPTDIMDACIAIDGNEGLPTTTGIDRSITTFSKMAITRYKNTGNEEAILELRNRWFNVPKDELEYNSQEWSHTRYKDKIEEADAWNDFYKKSGFSGAWWGNKITGSLDEQLIRQEIEPILKEAFIRTNSVTQAEIIAGEYLRSFVKESTVNGNKEVMVNPPPDNFIKELKSKAEKIRKYANKYCSIKPGGKKIYIGALSVTKPIYGFYFLEDSSDPSSKIWLEDPYDKDPMFKVDLNEINRSESSKVEDNG